MRTIQLKLYRIDELTEDARERALQYLRNVLEYPWTWDNRRTLEEFSKIFPVRVVGWSYGNGPEYIHWKFIDTDTIANLNGIRLYKYLWNTYKYLWNTYTHEIYKGRWYYKDGKVRYSKVFLDNSCVLTGYWLDNVILEPIYNFLKKPTDATFYYLLDECLTAWVRACAEDVELFYSDASLIDAALANNYEFLEDGTLTMCAQEGVL